MLLDYLVDDDAEFYEDDGNGLVHIRNSTNFFQKSCHPTMQVSLIFGYLLLKSLAMLETRLNEVHQLLGEQHDIPDKEIRETLWYYYFDLEKTVAWLLGSIIVLTGY